MQYSQELKSGLLSTPKWIPSAFLYDDIGSELFEEVCSAEEYYVTQKELEILNLHSSQIFSNLSVDSIVELGCGNGEKLEPIIRELIAHNINAYYQGIDINKDAQLKLRDRLFKLFPDFRTSFLSCDYMDGLRDRSTRRGYPLVMFLGSSIGNLDNTEVDEFISKMKTSIDARHALLIGADLVKESDVLERAYDDASGANARFSLNAFTNINRQFDANFVISKLSYEVEFLRERRTVEARFRVKEDHEVSVKELDIVLNLSKGESIISGLIRKFEETEVVDIFERNGYVLRREFIDKKCPYGVYLFQTI